jgi:hypothetical protein
MAIVIGFGGIGKMVSKRAARVHAPETYAPILDSRFTPSRKVSAKASLAQSLIR